jgi:FkbM family methyltransferase
MFDKIKSSAWSFIRPFHRPITTAFRRRLGRNYANHPEMELPPPYEYLQLDVERHLHDYLHVPPGEISQIVIVGALDAGEVLRMERIYSQAGFLCFEPNPISHERLVKKFVGKNNVSISSLALGKSQGKTRFYELPMTGNGSLLEPDAEKWAISNKQSEKAVTFFEVIVSTLDREAAPLKAIDLLWMDVQGAEGDVFAGGLGALQKTKSIFVEVALVDSPYKGAALFSNINQTLVSQGFQCVGLGVDAWNGAGNAFFVKDFEKCTVKNASLIS